MVQTCGKEARALRRYGHTARDKLSGVYAHSAPCAIILEAATSPFPFCFPLHFDTFRCLIYSVEIIDLFDAEVVPSEMAEPLLLSFAASIIAVATLAGTVATKGYGYIKAVKDCSDDVRRLIAEVSALCGILERLVVLFPRSKPRSLATNHAVAQTREVMRDDGAEQGDVDPNSDSDDEVDPSSNALEPPDFIYECQKTLREIERVLNKFGHAKSKPSQPTQKTSRFRLSELRRLAPEDLKWPLSRSKTMQLFEALERHKNTCTLALAGDGLTGIHAVLEQTKLSNRHLADLRAKQEKMLELCISEEEGEREPTKDGLGKPVCRSFCRTDTLNRESFGLAVES